MAKVNKQFKKGGLQERTAHLGERLRALRTARKLTLEQLSHMAGVSKAMLSQIEQDKVNPTVAVILKIANALQLGIAELVKAPTNQSIFQVISASDKNYIFRSDPLCTIRTLSPLSLEKAIEFYCLVLKVGGELVSEQHFPGTEEFLYVAKGRVALKSGEQTVEIARGDTCHYRADVPHAIRNVGRGQVEAYLIVRYKSE